MKKLKPETILIGEAPGYKGCSLTGVPFTSEWILLKNPFKLDIFSGNYQKSNSESHYHKEATATILWNYLAKSENIPLLWNAFPFHPHKPGKLDSNRSPTSKELDLGILWINRMLKLFDIQKLVAIGNRAQYSLNKHNFACTKIRHPSYGGKAEFINGMSLLK